MDSKIREFIASLPAKGQKGATPAGVTAGGEADNSLAALDPDETYGQTLRASGYQMGSDPCNDACWEAYQRCLRESSRGPAFCLAELHTCQQNCAKNQAPGAPNPKGLTAVDLPFVSLAGSTTPVPNPQMGGDYDLCVKISNRGAVNAPSGPFVVRFDLQGEQLVQVTFNSTQDLQVGFSVTATAHLGNFPKPGKYSLKACVASAASQSKDISCTSKFDFTVGAGNP